MPARLGPQITLECTGCVHHRTERDSDDDDKYTLYHACCHPEVTGGLPCLIGYSANTPDWCPYRRPAPNSPLE